MYKNIVVAGGGVLGSQIAFQAAYCGFDVTIWLRSEGSIGRTQPKLDHLKEVYLDTIEKMSTPEGKRPRCGPGELPSTIPLIRAPALPRSTGLMKNSNWSWTWGKP